MRRHKSEFWHEVDAFIREHLPLSMTAAASSPQHDTDFLMEIAKRGWIGMGWPEEFGGRPATVQDRSDYWELMKYHGAPVDGHLTIEMVGRAILELGSDDLKREFLPRLTSGTCMLALGYTEPEAGSDLLSVRTKAVKVEGGYLVTGTKMFTSLAHCSDYVFLLARTSPGSDPGCLSFFLVPLDADGIEVREIRTLGGQRTNATFYDNVFVSSELLVGREGAGRQVMNTALTVERQMIGSFMGEVHRTLDNLVEGLEQTGGLTDPVVASQVRRWKVEAKIAGALARGATRAVDGDPSGNSASVAAAMAKVAVTELLRAMTGAALELIGERSLVSFGQPFSVAGGLLEHAYRHAQIAPIYGGANEIQRNIIAQRGLGMPRPGRPRSTNRPSEAVNEQGTDDED